MRLTASQLAALPKKARRDRHVTRLYMQHDYLMAYALHTDRRVQKEGYQAAAGADASRDNWDSHGDLQRDFLISQGLRPEHRLLEIGCGGGRLARKIASYLDVGHYYGTDISEAAMAAAADLAISEGWSDREPRFWRPGAAPSGMSFDFVWEYSVFTHLPPAMIEQVMRSVVEVLAPDGVFLWSYFPAPDTARYGLMQFRARHDVYVSCAQRAGLTFEEVPEWVRSAGHEPGRWSGYQSVARSRRAR